MIIGVAVGTYSSIFIASPIVLWWTRARGGGKTSLQRKSLPSKPSQQPRASLEVRFYPRIGWMMQI